MGNAIQWQQRIALYSFIIKNKNDLPDWIFICKCTHIKSNFFLSSILLPNTLIYEYK